MSDHSKEKAEWIPPAANDDMRLDSITGGRNTYDNKRTYQNREITKVLSAHDGGKWTCWIYVTGADKPVEIMGMD